MSRLDDLLRLDAPDPYARVVPQTRHRGAVTVASCPQLPVDTDDRCAPDREQGRACAAVRTGLGVPALSVSTHLDRTGEPREDDDCAALRRRWAAWRAGRGKAG
ncbi:hypothetical protein AB0M97_16530 [Streptomyces sp. NPDC051207]|uniref:hypothetical protein n=1 Tax=Streptomyces sp. NPDC051207 TaxID=3154641 RepID=UPI0034176EE4